jgi:hypothetical protein
MTKKILATVVTFACFSNFSFGQIKKESILLGGQIGYSNTDIDYSGNQPNQKNESAAFNISIGKAVKENSIFGLNLTYLPAKIKNYFNGANFVSTNTNQYNFGIFDRKYKKLAKDFYFFTELGASYIKAKQTSTDTSGINLETIKQSGAQVYLTPGLSYKILNKLHLEIIIPNIVTIQYAVTKDKTPTLQAKQKQLFFNSSLNSTGGGLTFVGVGFHFIL